MCNDDEEEEEEEEEWTPGPVLSDSDIQRGLLSYLGREEICLNVFVSLLKSLCYSEIILMMNVHEQNGAISHALG